MRPALVAWLLRHALPVWLAPDYAVLVGLAGLLGAAATLRLARKDGAAAHLEARALCLGYLAALAGGYVFEALRAIPDALAQGSWGPILGAGRAAYGGLLAGVAASTLYLVRRRQPIAPFLDRLTPLLGITFACVRTGCFLAGCDYGRPTAGPLGVRFPPESPAALDHAAQGWVRAGAPSLPVHPTELYEAALGLVALLVAWAWLRRGLRDGRAFAAWLSVYAAGRFALELLRGDTSRGLYAGLSTAQIVSLALLAVIGWWGLSRRAPPARGVVRAAAAGVLVLAVLAPEDAHSQPAPKKAPAAAPSASASAAPSAPPPRVIVMEAPANTPQYPVQYQYPYPPPVVAPPPQQPVAPAVPAAPAEPEAPPPKRYVTLRVSSGPALTLGNPAVPLGGFADLLAVGRVPVSRSVRFEVGLEGRFFRNIEATHATLGLPLGFAFVLGKPVELTTMLAIGHTWFLFDSPFFRATNAWGVRYEIGVQFPVGSRVLLGTTPAAFEVQSSQSLGVLTTWQPRVWVGVAL